MSCGLNISTLTFLYFSWCRSDGSVVQITDFQRKMAVIAKMLFRYSPSSNLKENLTLGGTDVSFHFVLKILARSVWAYKLL